MKIPVYEKPPQMSGEKVLTPCGELEYLPSSDILWVRYLNPKVSLTEAKQHIKAVENYVGGASIKHYVISDLTQVRFKPSKEVRDYFSTKEALQNCHASALLVASGFSKMLGMLFLNFNKPVIPTRLFTKWTQAVAWLDEQKKKAAV